ncbi:hypothetical protein M9Y10_005976 [Tritrichomonas musculus]|uniref:MatE family protein n=1 Tax=Tritrichomonas musculus TaxID=1915356 RepID=A0ABR2JEF6_9EUKA
MNITRANNDANQHQVKNHRGPIHDNEHNQTSMQAFNQENPKINNQNTQRSIKNNPNREDSNHNHDRNQTNSTELTSFHPSNNILNNQNNPINSSNNNQNVPTSEIQRRGSNQLNHIHNQNSSRPSIDRHISQFSIASGSDSMLNENNNPNRPDSISINNTNNNINGDPKCTQFHDPDQGKALYRLSGMPALKTVVLLSIGPILNQFFSAIEGIVQTIWVNKAMGKKGIASISSYMPFENICRAFGLTAACSGSNAVGGFIATNKYNKEEGSQVICDLLRVCIIIGIVTPAVLCPTVKMAVKWFGASEEIVNLGYKYIFPILICTFVTCIYLAYTGFLIGEGRTMLYACITIVTSIMNIAFFCPLFILGFKIGIVGAGISTVLSQGIAMIILSFFYFTGAFTVKPKFNQLFKRFSPLTKGALKACLSQGIANLSLSIPGILIRKFVGKSDKGSIYYNDSISGFHAVTRWALLVHRIIIGFITGYLPAASYALNGKNYRRYLFLTLHVNWLTFAWGSLTAILTFAIPRQLALMFSKDPGYVEWATPMLRISNSGGFFIFAQYTVGNMLRSLGMGFMAAVMGTLVHIIGMVGFVLLLYYTDKHNAKRLMYAYPLSSVFGLIVGFAFVFYPYYKIYKEMKQKKDELSQDNIQSNSQPLPPVEVANFDDMA